MASPVDSVHVISIDSGGLVNQALEFIFITQFFSLPFQMDARNIGASRSSGSVDKTKDISKINNRSSGEEKPPGLTANNSWEKPKMKKKRSASNSVGPIRLVDGDRERKQEVLPKLVGDARPKVTVPHSSR